MRSLPSASTAWTQKAKHVLRCLQSWSAAACSISFAGLCGQAARSLYHWFLALSSNDAVDLRALDAVKQMLAELYRGGDAELRNCIVASCLEHLFESRRLAEYFADWQDDPVLAAGYSEALEWGRDFWPGQRGY